MAWAGLAWTAAFIAGLLLAILTHADTGAESTAADGTAVWAEVPPPASAAAPGTTVGPTVAPPAAADVTATGDAEAPTTAQLEPERPVAMTSPSVEAPVAESAGPVTGTTSTTAPASPPATGSAPAVVAEPPVDPGPAPAGEPVEVDELGDPVGGSCMAFITGCCSSDPSTGFPPCADEPPVADPAQP